MSKRVRGPAGAIGRQFARPLHWSANQWEGHPYRMLGLLGATIGLRVVTVMLDSPAYLKAAAPRSARSLRGTGPAPFGRR